MISGRVSFGSSVDSVEFREVEFHTSDSRVGCIRVVAKNGGQISISIEVRKVGSRSEAMAVARREATRVVNILSISLGRHVKDVTMPKADLHEDPAIHGAHLVSEASMVCFLSAVEAVVVLGEEQVTRLEQAFLGTQPESEEDMHLFRVALSSEDVASKFLALYRFLYRCAGDKQHLVDGLIMNHKIGHVDVRESPQKLRQNEERPEGKKRTRQQVEYDPNFDETVYTRLRNEYTHRPEVPLDQVRNEMETNLPGLISVVRNVITSI